jgi:hypothetical protein
MYLEQQMIPSLLTCNWSGSKLDSDSRASVLVRNKASQQRLKPRPSAQVILFTNRPSAQENSFSESMAVKIAN